MDTRISLTMSVESVQRILDWAFCNLDTIECELSMEKSMNEWRRARIAELEKRAGESEKPLDYDEIMEELEVLSSE